MYNIQPWQLHFMQLSGMVCVKIVGQQINFASSLLQTPDGCLFVTQCHVPEQDDIVTMLKFLHFGSSG